MSSNESKRFRCQASRDLLMTLGIISLTLGIIGIFLPLLPTTPFLLLSSWCFVRSSEKFHNWLYNHKHLGPIIKAWEEKGAINLKAKILAILFIAASLVLILRNEDISQLHLPVALILLTASLFIVTRPSA